VTAAQPYLIRKATLEDRSELQALIDRSARALAYPAYTPEQIESALRGAFGVDSQLIRDGTYFVAEADGSRLAGCGGWSRRRTLFGGDAHASRDASELVPGKDAARIRAFFVDPAHARRGVGRAILQRCEAEARERGFTRFELMAMRSGVDFYLAQGYAPGPAIQHELQAGLNIEFVPMSKAADPVF
jgi:GNAT superfamily N-acetyltransferase